MYAIRHLHLLSPCMDSEGSTQLVTEFGENTIRVIIIREKPITLKI